RSDAGDAVPNVGGVGRLAHLAVADHVDAGCDLPCDDLVDCLGSLRLEHGGIDGAALLPREDEIAQRFRPRQAAGVGCEDAVFAGLHSEYPSCAGFRVASPNFLVAASNSAVCKGWRLARVCGRSTSLAPLRTNFEYPVSTWVHPQQEG